MGLHDDAASSSAGPAAAAAAAAVGALSASSSSWQCTEAMSDLCAGCRVGLKEVGLVHGDEMCLCLCKGCAVAYGCGSVCPMCGQLVQEQLEM
jgi:hypothetical protein